MTKNTTGFSLIEVALSLGVVSFALLAILGLMPVGLKSVGEAGDATRTSMIAANAEASIKALRPPIDFSSNTARAVGPFYYDRDGIPLSSSTGGFYRVDATIASGWANPLANVDQGYLRPVSAVARWPIDTNTGNPLGSNTTSFTFYVAKP